MCGGGREEEGGGWYGRYVGYGEVNLYMVYIWWSENWSVSV